jgi:glycine dehydrogenase subunit 1
MPGRIVGQTVDSTGVRGFVNTLQTREQHIRREKATSNICTNEALAAITAAVYLSLLGPQGLRAAARAGVSRAHAIAARLAEVPGCAIANDGPFFDRFVLRSATGGWSLRGALLARAIHVAATSAHFGERDDVIVQCTELTTDADADALVDAVAAAASGAREAVAAR